MVIIITGAIVIARGKKGQWFFKHKMLGAAGAFCGIAGFTSIATFKILNGYPHLKSPHAIGGFITVILMAITPVLGYMVVNKAMENLRSVHKKSGYTVAILALLTFLSKADDLLKMIGLLSRTNK